MAKYEILNYIEVPVRNIEPNPLNPRPKFHLTDDDPKLLALGDDIAANGQHRPGIIYEMVNHWQYPDKPGHYMLLQGESRWRACRLARLDHYRALLVPTPKDETEEREWLGIEEAHKRDWGAYFLLRFAWELAAKLGLAVTDHEIAVRTGLSKIQLRLAEKLSKLTPEVQGLVAEYEKKHYEKSILGRTERGNTRGGLSASGVNTAEFTTTRAGQVYDIFTGLRENLPKLVEKLDDVDLQVKIARWATTGDTRSSDLDELCSQIRTAGKNPPAGLITQIADLVQNNRRVRDVVRAGGGDWARKLQGATTQAKRLEDSADELRNHMNQLGADIPTLNAQAYQMLSTSRRLDELERTIRARIRDLETKSAQEAS